MSKGHFLHLERVTFYISKGELFTSRKGHFLHLKRGTWQSQKGNFLHKGEHFHLKRGTFYMISKGALFTWPQKGHFLHDLKRGTFYMISKGALFTWSQKGHFLHDLKRGTFYMIWKGKFLHIKRGNNFYISKGEFFNFFKSGDLCPSSAALGHMSSLKRAPLQIFLPIVSQFNQPLRVVCIYM